ncbi:MAG TPA: hypothetical protein VLG92_02290 [Candidatus Saccharimonadia bacterium]|nr:hypothetical protein [Candidatus Saccharimonadia bacterium]
MGPFAPPHHNKVMFAMLMVSVLIALPFAIGAYYYRSKRQNIDAGAVQVAALAQVGKKTESTNAPKKGSTK